MRERFVFTFNFRFLAQEPVYFFLSLSCLFLYWSLARAEHELTTGVTLSTFPLQSLHRENTSWWSLPFFTAFVLSACSWAVCITLSVSRFNSPAFTTSLILNPLFLSWTDHAMFSLFMLPVFHSFGLLYFPHQSLLLVVALNLQPSEVSHCCLQHNRRG